MPKTTPTEPEIAETAEERVVRSIRARVNFWIGVAVALLGISSAALALANDRTTALSTIANHTAEIRHLSSEIETATAALGEVPRNRERIDEVQSIVRESGKALQEIDKRLTRMETILERIDAHRESGRALPD